MAVAEFGSGVQVMGPGRDGGRDLYHRGSLVWQKQGDVPAEIWEGYTVLQIKHMAVPSDNAGNLAWLWGQVRKELDAWADPDGDRVEVPRWMLFITNVPLTPFPKAGSHDLLQSRIAAYREKLSDDTRDFDSELIKERLARLARLKRIEKVRIWDGHQIQTLLNVHAGIRAAFPGFLTVGDVFAALTRPTDQVSLEELGEALRAHAMTTLAGEGFIYFDEAGAGEATGVPVHEVAIDLPATFGADAQPTSVIRYVLDRAEHVLKPGVTTFGAPQHLILTGAPGNGKTTIAKFLVQVFRAAILEGRDDLGDGHRETIAGTVKALRRFRRGLPKHRRWPIRVDLAEFVQEYGSDTDRSLLRWIAEKVSRRSDMGTVTPWKLKSWLERWPWLLILDGLDEVTEPAVRKRLIERVIEFVHDADAYRYDLLVILTTRPVGYTENIAPGSFERIDLDNLEITEAVRYGELATKVRLGGDVDRIERVCLRLRKAAEDEALQHLLRTPLQVLILTIIIDGSGQLAPDRYNLFRGYYDTVFKRERDKTSGLTAILQEHGPQIQQLHERVGFELQVRSETGERAVATLLDIELRQITWQVLDEAGYKPSGEDQLLLEKIIRAATHRLVLIAPRGTEGYGFDVRSLQELMAAMCLGAGPISSVMERLKASAASPFWRNTWLFAAGQLFSTPQKHQYDALVGLVESIDDDASRRLGRAVPIGPSLALDIIDDGMTRSLPRWRDRLVSHGLKVLTQPELPDPTIVAKYLVRFANTGDAQRNTIAEGLRDALGGTAAARETASVVQRIMPAIAEEIRAHADVRGLGVVRKRPDAPPPPDAVDGWDDFDIEIATYPCPEPVASLLRNAAEVLRRLTSDTAGDDEIATLEKALDVNEVAAALSSALEHVISHEPHLVVQLRDVVMPRIHRRLIGEHLRQLTADEP